MKLLAGVLLASALLMSCEKDDKTETKNYLKIGDTEYELSVGSLDNYGTSTYHEGYNTDLHLLSKGLDFNEDGGFVGMGTRIAFEMFSKTGLALDNTEYVFNSTEPYTIGTFDWGRYYINYNAESGNSEVSKSINEGTVKVSKKGEEYTITINAKDEDGKIVKGFYKGKLNYYDWTRGTKSSDINKQK